MTNDASFLDLIISLFDKFTNWRFLLDYEDGVVVSVVAPGVDVKLPILGVDGALDIRIRGGGRSERGLGKLYKNWADQNGMTFVYGKYLHFEILL